MNQSELTTFQLLSISRRIDDIDTLLDDDTLPDDIHDNLINELEYMEYQLKESIKARRINESGLKVVK